MTCEMQTANEYRAMVIQNDRQMHDDLIELYKAGSLTELFRKMNSYMHLILIPWENMRTGEDKPPDGNRWLPLFHNLILWLEEITDTDCVLGSGASYRFNWSWNQKDRREKIMNWYRKSTPTEFLTNVQKEWKASWNAIGCEMSENHIPIMTVLLDRCREEAKAQDYRTDSNEMSEKVPTLTINRFTPPTNQKEITMNPIKVEERTFIDNTDAKDVTDEQIFIDIGNLEAEARVLSALKTKSTKLNKRIKALRKSARKLAAYVDAR